MVRWITSHANYTEFFKPDYQLRTANFYVPVLIRDNELAVGITISRKVGNAVRRNLLKRRIKAWLRNSDSLYPSGYRNNLVAKRGAAELSWQDLSTQLSALAALLNQKAAQ